MTEPIMSDLQWARARRFLDKEIKHYEWAASQPNTAGWGRGYYEGQRVALLRIKGQFFLTEEERIRSEQVRREMFG